MAEIEWKIESVEEVKELSGQVAGRITYYVYLEITESGVDLGSVTLRYMEREWRLVDDNSNEGCVYVYVYYHLAT